MPGAIRPGIPGFAVPSAERQYRGAHPLRAEARESLRVAVLAERLVREQLGGGHDALATATVESDGEHRLAPSLVCFAGL
jgi:hypothetical protein